MNWGLLLQFAYGFVNCLEQSRAERRQEMQSGQRFSERMRGLSQMSGIPIVGVTDDRVTFQVPAENRTYAVVILNGNPLRIGACSCIMWKRGSVPPGLLEALERQNRLGGDLSFDLIESAKDAFIIIEAKLSPGTFSLEAFQAALDEMMPRILAFDHWLIENGHVDGLSAWVC